jgi:hypothetical protein
LELAYRKCLVADLEVSGRIEAGLSKEDGGNLQESGGLNRKNLSFY